ncbi:MAG: arginyl-tRNA synthetase [Candidatus Parcubacteria bacterium]|jgi:arginyl-tRNA synthetase|nr:arginyl-tRNA synthetase [Candidatus Parcubacteria bacterium]
MIERIRSVIGAEIAKLGASEVGFAIEWPAELSHGDFATNAAMAASKALGKPPREIADALVPALRGALGADAANVEAAGPGFVNITLSGEAIARELEAAMEAKEVWGRNDIRKGERVMIEYGNPNPFKEMHLGHLVGAIVGESLSRLLEASGAHTLRDTFGGDVGPQVAKALWALRKDGITDIASAGEIGKAYTRGATAYEESETAKAEIDGLNTKIYEIVDRQEEAAALPEDDRALLYIWQKGREVSMEEFERLFKILGTRHDYTFFDSDTTRTGVRVVRDSLAQGIFEESEGAIVYKGEKKGLFTLVFITSRGNPTYETKDIGLAFLKEERVETDRVVIVTAVEQISHFKVVLAALEDIAPKLAAKTSHIAHGLLRLTTGKMSSRKGNVITAAEVIRDLITAANERNPDPVVAEQVAVGALKYMILRSALGGNIAFDPERSLSLDGDSGPYLQYAYVRAMSILANAGEAADSTDVPDEAYDIARLITRFPEVVKKAQSLEAPHVVAQYLTQLAGEWNSFYAKERIIGGNYEAHKLSLVRAFANTMKNGLWLLGIPVPERM